MLLIALITGWIGITSVLSLLFQAVVGPGALVAIIVWYVLSKPRYLVRTAGDVAVMKKGLLNDQPEAVVTRLDLARFEQSIGTSSGRRHVDVGPEQLWVKESELDALRRDLG